MQTHPRTPLSTRAGRDGAETWRVRSRLTLFSVACCLCLTTVVRASVDDLKAQTDQAMQAESKGRHVEAVRLYEQVLEKAREELGAADPRIKALQDMLNAAKRKTPAARVKAPGPAKAPYDPSLGQTNLVSMIVPDPAYPDGQCTIWVPSEAARQDYLHNTQFVESPLTSQTIALATPADVNPDLTRYGYKTSPKPPAYVPVIQYPDETPIYPFAGQMVPGTNVQYTTPPIDPVWLVDTTPDQKVVPALTTIDFHDFRSINWPRERYFLGVSAANNVDSDSRLSGTQMAQQVELHDYALIEGDYEVPEQSDLFVLPGTVIAFLARTDTDGRFGSPNLSQIQATGYLSIRGTKHRPVIITSSSQSPSGQDWERVNTEPSRGCTIEYSIIEYGLRNVSLNGLPGTHGQRVFTNNIVRYAYSTDESLGPSQGLAYSYLDQLDNVSRNEIHSNRDNISTFGHNDNALVANNLIYNYLLPDTVTNENLHEFGPNTKYRFWNNTLYATTFWGVEIGISDFDFQNNIVAINNAGIMFYLRDGPQSPVVDCNDLWANRFHDYAKEIEYGKWEFAEPSGHNNIALDPLFINPKITDFMLHYSSPCINAGTLIGAPSTDFNGKGRDQEPDIGAYEVSLPGDSAAANWLAY